VKQKNSLSVPICGSKQSDENSIVLDKGLVNFKSHKGILKYEIKGIEKVL
jgi:hypothetical protein